MKRSNAHRPKIGAPPRSKVSYIRPSLGSLPAQRVLALSISVGWFDFSCVFYNRFLPAFGSSNQYSTAFFTVSYANPPKRHVMSYPNYYQGQPGMGAPQVVVGIMSAGTVLVCSHAFLGGRALTDSSVALHATRGAQSRRAVRAKALRESLCEHHTAHPNLPDIGCSSRRMCGRSVSRSLRAPRRGITRRVSSGRGSSSARRESMSVLRRGDAR